MLTQCIRQIQLIYFTSIYIFIHSHVENRYVVYMLTSVFCRYSWHYARWITAHLCNLETVCLKGFAISLSKPSLGFDLEGNWEERTMEMKPFCKSVNFYNDLTLIVVVVSKPRTSYIPFQEKFPFKWSHRHCAELTFLSIVQLIG